MLPWNQFWSQPSSPKNTCSVCISDYILHCDILRGESRWIISCTFFSSWIQVLHLHFVTTFLSEKYMISSHVLWIGETVFLTLFSYWLIMVNDKAENFRKLAILCSCLKQLEISLLVMLMTWFCVLIPNIGICFQCQDNWKYHKFSYVV